MFVLGSVISGCFRTRDPRHPVTPFGEAVFLVHPLGPLRLASAAFRGHKLTPNLTMYGPEEFGMSKPGLVLADKEARHFPTKKASFICHFESPKDHHVF